MSILVHIKYIHMSAKTQVMDVLANKILAASMCAPGKMDYVASEEEEEPTYCSVVLQNAAFQGDYAGVFDPLDGSSNIEAGLPVGTIFGIYRRPKLSLTPHPDPLEAIMQPGSKLLASGNLFTKDYIDRSVR